MRILYNQRICREYFVIVIQSTHSNLRILHFFFVLLEMSYNYRSSVDNYESFTRAETIYVGLSYQKDDAKPLIKHRNYSTRTYCICAKNRASSNVIDRYSSVRNLTLLVYEEERLPTIRADSSLRDSSMLFIISLMRRVKRSERDVFRRCCL